VDVGGGRGVDVLLLLAGRGIFEVVLVFIRVN